MIKYYKLALTVLLVSCSLLHGMKKQNCHKQLTIGTKKACKKNEMAIVFGNPKTFFILTDYMVGEENYDEIKFNNKSILKEKIMQIIGTVKYYRMSQISSLGYLRINNLTPDKVEKLSNLKEVAIVGPFKYLYIDGLKKDREQGNTVLNNVFKNKLTSYKKVKHCPTGSIVQIDQNWTANKGIKRLLTSGSTSNRKKKKK